MLDMNTFIEAVYVIVADFCKMNVDTTAKRPGPSPKLDCVSVLTLAIVGQFRRFGSEREFYRFAKAELGGRFACLPDRTQYNRQLRRFAGVLSQLAISVAEELGARNIELQAIDCTPIRVRDNHRRGNPWMPGDSDIGYSTRLGWYQGFRLLVAVGAYGAITGYCFSSASTNDRQLAEALLSLRYTGSHAVASVGLRALGNYVADKGFAGKHWWRRWKHALQATVIMYGQHDRWPRAARRWLAHHRQIIETVFAALHLHYGLDRERPHTVGGLSARLAAKVALHNIVITLNHRLQRPSLATADLLAWS